MPSKNASQRLRDILDNVEAIQSFVAGMDFAMFAADRKTMYAVTRALEIVSEAGSRTGVLSRVIDPHAHGGDAIQPHGFLHNKRLAVLDANQIAVNPADGR